MRLDVESLTSCLILFLVILNCEVSSEKVFRLFVCINSFGRFLVTLPGNDQNFVRHVVEKVYKLLLLGVCPFLTHVQFGLGLGLDVKDELSKDQSEDVQVDCLPQCSLISIDFSERNKKCARIRH